MVLGETVYTPLVPQCPPRKRWTRGECQIVERSDLWTGQHFELIEGELIHKMGKKQPHVFGVRRVAHILGQLFGWDSVFTEAPIDVAPPGRLRPQSAVQRIPAGTAAGRQPCPGGRSRRYDAPF